MIPEEKEEEKLEPKADLWAKFNLFSEPNIKYKKKVELLIEI